MFFPDDVVAVAALAVHLVTNTALTGATSPRGKSPNSLRPNLAPPLDHFGRHTDHQVSI